MEKKCPQCGAPLPAGTLAGLCPACLLSQAANETATQPSTPGFVPPNVEELGALFPQLEIRALIGKGGMGAVYEARQPALDRIVALKILPPRPDGGPDFAERFNREARALARLNHPNIVTVHEFGQVRDMPFFIMEYVDGLNLRQLEQGGKLSPREALQIVPQICEALQFAHDAGIVHRDIKPDNILVDKKGRVKIADFGIAKIMGTTTDTRVPETQGAIGTPNYMAPEQLEKPQSVDHRADIFSLGVVFYEMLTGELPLGKFAPPSSGPRGLRVDVRLDDVVLRALEKEPERRYQHASQVKTAVETIASTPPGTPPPPAPPGIPPGLPPNSGSSPDEILSRDYALKIGHSVHRGWALLKANFWPLVGIHALITLLVAIADSVFARLSTISSRGETIADGTSLVGLLLTGPLLGGAFLYFLKTLRREPVTAETAFAGFGKRFLHLFLVHLVSGLLTILGFMCFVLPGIYLLVAWSFSLVLVIDKGLEFWPAMELSRKMVNKHWWKVFGFFLVIAGVWLLGLLGCCVGVLISAPAALAMFLYAYEDIFGNIPERAPAPHPLPAAPPVAGAPAAVSPKPATPAPEPNPVPPTGPNPSGPIGPTGTVLMPAATPPPSGGGISQIVKYALGAIAGLFLLLIAAFLFRMAEIHRMGCWEIVLMFALLAFGGSILLLVVGVFVAAVGGGTRFLKCTLFGAGILFLLFLIASFAALMEHHHLQERIIPVTAAPYQPMAPFVPAAPAPPASPSGNTTNPRRQLIARIRQELDKVSVHCQTMQFSSTNDHSLLISFSGLQELRLVDDTNVWRDISGTLTAVQTRGQKWVFEGHDELSVVRFELPALSLQQVLTVAGEPEDKSVVTENPALQYSHDDMAERLEVAKSITEITIRDKTLAALAAEAEGAGDLELTKSALGEMTEMEQQGEATHAIVLLLAKNGHRREAIEMAQGITSIPIRDQTLAELAQ